MVYVVKLIGNPQGLRVLVNELVAGMLANLLSVPVPTVRIVEVSAELLQMAGLADRFRPGRQFGSRSLTRGHNDLWPALLRKICNKEELAGIIVLDTWVNLLDRHRDNFLIVLDSDRRYRAYSIDYGWAFGGAPDWTINRLRTEARDVRVVCWEEFREFVKEADSFVPWLARLESIDMEAIREVVDSVPAEWGISLEERAALTDYLVIRQPLVRQAITREWPQFV